MKNIFVAVLFILSCTEIVIGQATEGDNSEKSEIEKLSFITGEWEGEGWMMGRDGTKHAFSQIEHVQFKLDTTAILIEGIGKSDGEIIHNALAVVRFNPQEGDYSFNSYLSTGETGDFKGELIDNKFYWYPGENMRYIIELNEEGQWYEIGEIKQNGTWFRFFEMTLNKVVGAG